MTTFTWRRQPTTAQAFLQSLVDRGITRTMWASSCTQGTGCAPGTRNLLDLFEVGIDPLNGLAAVVYVG